MSGQYGLARSLGTQVTAQATIAVANALWRNRVPRRN